MMVLTVRHTGSILICCLLLFGLVTGRSVAADPVTMNADTVTYDHHPTSSAAQDGTIWFAWHGYSNGRDQIFARSTDPGGNVGILHTVSESGTTHGPPVIVAGSAEGVSVVWASKNNDRWSVVLRELRRGEWQNSVTLSRAEHDAIYPAAVRVSDGQLLAAWSEYSRGRWEIRSCRVDGDRASPSFGISSGAADAFRPALVNHKDQVWAFWDQCRGPDYSVHGRMVLPKPGVFEQVSPAAEHCLTPTALSHAAGLHVAWLRKIDVMGGPGVISQWHTLHTAVRGPTGWNQLTSPDGSSTAAELTHGLMAKIEPGPVATGGYLGARVRPMLLGDHERVWLLWERKSNHRGSTPTVSGDLVGRPSLAGQWQPPVVLRQERVDYHVVDPPQSADGHAKILASRLPRLGLRTYESSTLSLEEHQPFKQDDWTGWNPVELPVTDETPGRREVSAGGKTYQLYWADLHCHNGLTADAEGAPDEMHSYARDKAGLDVVVFTNNDFYNVPLTQYDFEVGHLFARTNSAARRGDHRPFLSLPGFEWTSRIPGVADAALADSGNWLPPYRNASYPNHRSVIYPPAGGPLVHFTEVGNDINRLNEAVRQAGGITISQHNAFKLSGHAVEIGLELTSGWSNYIASHPQRFHEPLNRGVRLGFTANGDTHRRAPGLSGALTGIYAEELTADAILQALRQRRCFATMGSQMFVDARADGSLMGGEITARDDHVSLTLHAIGTRPIAGATLVRDGVEIHRVPGGSHKEMRVTFTDRNLSRGTHWYYWTIRQERSARVLPGNLMPAHGHLAWSSPHWVVVK